MSRQIPLNFEKLRRRLHKSKRLPNQKPETRFIQRYAIDDTKCHGKSGLLKELKSGRAKVLNVHRTYPKNFEDYLWQELSLNDKNMAYHETIFVTDPGSFSGSRKEIMQFEEKFDSMFVRNNVKLNDSNPNIVNLFSPEIVEKACEYLNIFEPGDEKLNGQSFIGLPLSNSQTYLMMPWPWTRAHLGYIDGIMIPKKASYVHKIEYGITFLIPSMYQEGEDNVIELEYKYFRNRLSLPFINKYGDKYLDVGRSVNSRWFRFKFSRDGYSTIHSDSKILWDFEVTKRLTGESCVYKDREVLDAKGNFDLSYLYFVWSLLAEPNWNNTKYIKSPDTKSINALTKYETFSIPDTPHNLKSTLNKYDEVWSDHRWIPPGRNKTDASHAVSSYLRFHDLSANDDKINDFEIYLIGMIKIMLKDVRLSGNLRPLKYIPAFERFYLHALKKRDWELVYKYLDFVERTYFRHGQNKKSQSEDHILTATLVRMLMELSKNWKENPEIHHDIDLFVKTLAGVSRETVEIEDTHFLKKPENSELSGKSDENFEISYKIVLKMLQEIKHSGQRHEWHFSTFGYKVLETHGFLINRDSSVEPTKIYKLKDNELKNVVCNQHGISDFHAHTDLARILDCNEVSFRVMHFMRYRNIPEILSFTKKDEVFELLYLPVVEKLTSSKISAQKVEIAQRKCEKCGANIFHVHHGQAMCDRCQFYQRNNNLRSRTNGI